MDGDNAQGQSWKTDLLVCAATWMELRAWWERDEDRSRLSEGEMAYSPALTFTLTGIGVPASLGRLFPLLQHVTPVRILNIGIAGAYPNSGLHIGDIVVGTSEVYGDVGFELPEAPHFQAIQESPFIKQMPLAARLYAASIPLTVDADLLVAPTGYQARQARGCTVGVCTGTAETGLRRESLFDVQFESMEGAAVAQAGSHYDIPVCEIRAISNFASTRDMQPDNIRLAIANLRDYLKQCKLSI